MKARRNRRPDDRAEIVLRLTREEARAILAGLPAHRSLVHDWARASLDGRDAALRGAPCRPPAELKAVSGAVGEWISGHESAPLDFAVGYAAGRLGQRTDTDFAGFRTGLIERLLEDAIAADEAALARFAESEDPEAP